jgi:hypothetical protein
VYYNGFVDKIKQDVQKALKLLLTTLYFMQGHLVFQKLNTFVKKFSQHFFIICLYGVLNMNKKPQASIFIFLR